MGPIIAKRIIYDDETIAGTTSVAYDTPTVFQMLVAQESEDEEVEANASGTPAQIKPYSTLVAIKLRLMFHSGSAGQRYRWILSKNPDGDASYSALTDGFFHSSDDTQPVRELRANVLAKGFGLIPSDKQEINLRIFVKRKTLRRLGHFREGDKLEFTIATSASAGKLSGFGTLYVRPK